MFLIECINNFRLLKSENKIDMSNKVLVTSTSQQPFNKICHLRVHRKRSLKKNKWYNSTGFFIARNVILTAAHNIHSQGFTKVDFVEINIGQCEDIQLFPAIKLKGLYTCSKSIFTPKAYKLSQKWTKRILNDYGVIIIPDKYIPKDFEWQNEFQLNKTYQYHNPMQIGGYPANRKNGNNGKKMYHQQKDIVIKNANVYTHSFDTEGGNSGSPVWDNANTVVGIHTFKRSGTLLDEKALKNINKWIEKTL